MTCDKLIPTILNLDDPSFITHERDIPRGFGPIPLPENILNGLITRHSPETGVEVTGWNVIFAHPVSLVKNKAGSDTIRQFRIIITLSPENCFLKRVEGHPQLIRQPEMSLLFISDDVNLAFDILAQKSLKLIDIKLSNAWVNGKVVNNRLSSEKNWKHLLAPSSPIVFYQVLDNKSITHVEELFDMLITGKGGGPGTASLIVSVILDFLEKAPTHLFIENNEVPEVHSQHLSEVLDILKSHLKKDLPKLDTIARMVALSESTLKRQFKEAFGKTIYNYYLDMKMELAHSMLLEEKLTVNQVALTLGYQNVSNFIDIFKRKYGFSPGSMKRKDS